MANQPGTWAAGPTSRRSCGPDDRREGRPRRAAAQRPRALRRRPVRSERREHPWGSPVYFYEYDPVASTLTQAPTASNNAREPVQLAADPASDRPGAAHQRDRHGRDLHARRRARSGVAAVDHVGADGAAPGPRTRCTGARSTGSRRRSSTATRARWRRTTPSCGSPPGTGTVTYCRTHDHSTMGVQTGAVIHSTSSPSPPDPLGAGELCVIANGIASDPVSSTLPQALEGAQARDQGAQENIKIGARESSSCFEDLRKINEGDWRERFGTRDWGEVVKQLAERSDELETEVRSLRSFIRKEERPEVGRRPSQWRRRRRRRRRRSAGGAGETPEASQEAAEEAGPRDAEQASCSRSSLAELDPAPAISWMPGPPPARRCCRPRT